MTRARRVTVVVALAAATVAMLSACDPAESGAAAIVGSTRISESQVNTAATDAVAAVESRPPGTTQPIDQTVLLRQNVTRLIASQLLEIAAADEGVTVTPADVDNILKQVSSGASSQAAFEADIAAQVGVPPSEIRSFARDYLLRKGLGEKLAPTGDPTAQSKAAVDKLAQVADTVGVTVSPRYGNWDPTTVSVTGVSNDLSEPLPSASDPASGQ